MHRHQIARSLVAVDDGVRLAVHAAVDRVHQPVAPAGLRMLEERRGQNAFAGGREGHVDRVVHAAGHDHFDRRIARPPAEDVRRARHERRLAGALVGLLGERALGPVDPAVGTRDRVRADRSRSRSASCPGTTPRADRRRRRRRCRSASRCSAARPHRAIRRTTSSLRAASSCRRRRRSCRTGRRRSCLRDARSDGACRRAAFRPCRSIPRNRRRRAGPRRRSPRRSAGRRAEDRRRARLRTRRHREHRAGCPAAFLSVRESEPNKECGDEPAGGHTESGD